MSIYIYFGKRAWHPKKGGAPKLDRVCYIRPWTHQKVYACDRNDLLTVLHPFFTSLNHRTTPHGMSVWT